jgi:hypothetical protein
MKAGGNATQQMKRFDESHQPGKCLASRLHRSRDRFKELFLLVAVLLTVGSVFSQTPSAFHLKGTANSTSYDRTGKTIISVDFDFELGVIGATWRMHLHDLDVERGTRQSFLYTELVNDGTDLYRVTYYPERVVKESKVPLKLQTVGRVQETRFPVDGTPVEKVLWLAFCANEEVFESTERLPQLCMSLPNRNIARVTVDFMQTTPILPRSIELWAKGMSIPDGRHIPLPHPFQDGYLAFELVSDFSGPSAGTPMVPEQVHARFYTVDTSVEPVRRIVATHLAISVSEVSEVNLQGSGFSLPTLPGEAIVSDLRFRDDSGRRFQYLETNASWVSRFETNPVHVLQQKAPAPRWSGTGDWERGVWGRGWWLLILGPQQA